jgi:hypothetical protein
MTALEGAARSPQGDDGWKWRRSLSTVDISPLVAVTLALWGAHNREGQGAPQIWDLNAIWAEMRAKQLAQSS